jgi:hypothetical protein
MQKAERGSGAGEIKMNDATPEEVVEALNCRPLTSQESYYLEWADESPKRNLTLLNDLLARLVTLSTTLAGGSAAFLSEAVVSPVFRFLAVVLFVASLLAALVGIYPRQEFVDYNPGAVKASKDRAFTRKKQWFTLAAALLGGGLAVVLLGALARLLGPA